MPATAGSYRSFEDGIRQALCGGDGAPQRSAAVSVPATTPTSKSPACAARCAPPLALLPAGTDNLPENRMRDTFETGPGTAPFETAETPSHTVLRIRPLDRPPLVP